MERMDELVATLQRGGVVACPTETWVGLLADANNSQAIAQVAELKGRPASIPIALLIPSVASARDVCLGSIPAAAEALMTQHWPGPLTILLSAAPDLDPRLTRDGKVGVRVPGPSPAADLVAAFGGPLTATSANKTGEPPVREASDLPSSILDRLGAAVPGRSPGGAPSTLVDATAEPLRIVRAGAIEIPEAAL